MNLNTERQNEHGRTCDHRCPQKPLVQHLGNRHLSKTTQGYFSRNPPTPNDAQKEMFVSLPSLEEPRSSKA